MYIYGGEEKSLKNDIFVLNLKSLTWTRFQEPTPLSGVNINGCLYKGNLLFLKRETNFLYKIDVGCWNIGINFFEIFPYSFKI